MEVCMKQIRKILRDKRGEGYIDVAVMVLCVMLVIALGSKAVSHFYHEDASG